jgi:hypothetical protein
MRDLVEKPQSVIEYCPNDTIKEQLIRHCSQTDWSPTDLTQISAWLTQLELDLRVDSDVKQFLKCVCLKYETLWYDFVSQLVELSCEIKHSVNYEGTIAEWFAVSLDENSLVSDLPRHSELAGIICDTIYWIRFYKTWIDMLNRRELMVS